MNLVYIDALFRHLLWTGDREYAKRMWPVVERHLAWERRLFRREFGPEKLPLYEAYAAIWASDNLQYSGGGTAHASAYNYFHNMMAARLAPLTGPTRSPTRARPRSSPGGCASCSGCPARAGLPNARTCSASSLSTRVLRCGASTTRSTPVCPRRRRPGRWRAGSTGSCRTFPFAALACPAACTPWRQATGCPMNGRSTTS